MMIEIAYEELRSIGVTALLNGGVPADHAALQIDLLLEADLRGRASHGVMRLPRLLKRIANNVANPKSIGVHRWRGSAFLEVDGERGLGPVIAMAALDAAAERLTQNGAALIAIGNNNHLGMLAWYAEKIAMRGLILIALSTSEALVHPWGGRFAMIGTNPIAIGVPTDASPFVLDMATSLVSMGQIHDYAQRGVPIPSGWAIDAEGNPTTNAVAARGGAIAPFGGPKGYALGLAIEIIVAALTASALGKDVVGTLDEDQPCNKGDLFILVDPSLRPETAQALSVYLDLVRLSGGREGPVMVPGDRALRERARRLKHGLTIPRSLWQQISDLATMPV